eukprot:1137446-Pelagomonas_calceolata.AAC.3
MSIHVEEVPVHGARILTLEPSCAAVPLIFRPQTLVSGSGLQRLGGKCSVKYRLGIQFHNLVPATCPKENQKT